MKNTNTNTNGFKNTSNCVFCNLTSNYLAGSDPDMLWDKVLHETPEFVVVPSKGAMIEGWLLIISKRHYLSVGAMPYLVRKELEYLSKDLCHVLSNLYCRPSIFEHGPSLTGSYVGCGIDQAHLHIVPINFDLTLAIESLSAQHGLNWNCNVGNTYEGLSLASSSKKPYLYYCDWRGNSQYCTSENIPSQFFRKAIASHIGAPNIYDYKKFVFERNVYNTIASLQSSIEGYPRKSSINTRISHAI
jgi:ATP adenylyltransferase